MYDFDVVTGPSIIRQEKRAAQPEPARRPDAAANETLPAPSEQQARSAAEAL